MTVKERPPVELQTLRGPMRTYLFQPDAPGKYPGVLLFSEIFQVTQPIRRTAAVLAGHGFLVAVPEIFHELEPLGSVLPYDTEGAERGNRHKVAKELASYDSDARAALDFLKADALCTGKLGVMGICVGGHLSFRAAMNPDVLAGVCFYATDIHKRALGKGMNDDSLVRAGEIQGEMLMIWGRQDPHVPGEGRMLIHQTMTKAGTHFTWHEFNGQHAFMRDEGPRYDPALALTCYGLGLELLKRKLGDGDVRAQTSATAPLESRH